LPRSPSNEPAPVLRGREFTGIRRALQRGTRCGLREGSNRMLPDDVEPVQNERRDRAITGVVTAVPILSLVLVGWQLWATALGWSDIAVFLLLYVLTGLGVTVGFHRLLTHRSFKTSRPVRGILAILGSAAVEGPVTSW